MVGATLRERLEAKGERDGTIALVVQGGGMRGVYSMGALAALEEEGLADAFDVVVGSSAGAINGAYLLAGQACEAVDVYVEFLSNKAFVNPIRLNKIVDIDYLVDDVLKEKCPLDVRALRASRTLLEVILTDAETGEPQIFTNRDDVDLYEVIRATAAMPALYNRRIEINGRSYVDGGVADSLPVLHALSLGALDLVGVITKLPGHRRPGKSALVRLMGRALAVGQSKEIRGMWGMPDPDFNASMELLEGLSSRDNVNVWGVLPSQAERLVARTTTDRDLLLDCAELGRQDMRDALARPPASSA